MGAGDTEDFAHIFRFDRYDSICRKCFRTVGSAGTVFDLLQQEQNHICDSDYFATSTMAGSDPQRLRKRTEAGNDDLW
jgi:hypothetical protein